MSVWPWSDLVSFVFRYASPSQGFRRVLELGCGAGANIPLFLSLGVDYCSVEGSATIVSKLHERYPQLRDQILVGDFTESIPQEGTFDVVVDRGSLTHNSTKSIEKALHLLSGRLRSGGRFLGFDWFSDAHADASRGVEVDSHSRAELRSRQFSGAGTVHFSDRMHLLSLLSGAGLSVERLEHKVIQAVIPDEGERIGSWNFVAVKP